MMRFNFVLTALITKALLAFCSPEENCPAYCFDPSARCECFPPHENSAECAYSKLLVAASDVCCWQGCHDCPQCTGFDCHGTVHPHHSCPPTPEPPTSAPIVPPTPEPPTSAPIVPPTPEPPTSAPTVAVSTRTSVFDCTMNVSLPMQMLRDEMAGTYSVDSLAIETGGYTKLFPLPFSMTNPPWDKINAGAINSKDGKAYAVVQFFVGTESFTSFVVRFDETHMEFIAEFTKAIAGTFDTSGNYWVSSDDGFLYNLGQVHMEDGYDDMNMADNYLTNPPQGYGKWEHGLKIMDIVTVTADYDQSGTAQYVIGLVRDTGAGVQVYMFNTATGNSYVTVAISTVGGPYGNSAWGAAWLYQNQPIFANNDALGVVLVKITNSSYADLKLIGKSDETHANDGLNCPSPPLAAPFPTCGHKGGYDTAPISDVDCNNALSGSVYNENNKDVPCAYDITDPGKCHVLTSTDEDTLDCCMFDE